MSHRAGVQSLLQHSHPMRALRMSTGAGDAPKKEKKGKGKKEGESKYGKTVLLPVTAFDQRANSLVR